MALSKHIYFVAFCVLKKSASIYMFQLFLLKLYKNVPLVFKEKHILLLNVCSSYLTKMVRDYMTIK